VCLYNLLYNTGNAHLRYARFLMGLDSSRSRVVVPRPKLNIKVNKLLSDAAKAFQKALEVNENAADVYHNLAATLATSARVAATDADTNVLFGKAFLTFGKALDMDPNNTDILSNWGTAHFRQGQMQYIEDKEKSHKTFVSAAQKYADAFKSSFGFNKDAFSNLGYALLMCSKTTPQQVDGDVHAGLTRCFECYIEAIKSKVGKKEFSREAKYVVKEYVSKGTSLDLVQEAREVLLLLDRLNPRSKTNDTEEEYNLDLNSLGGVVGTETESTENIVHTPTKEKKANRKPPHNVKKISSRRKKKRDRGSSKRRTNTDLGDTLDHQTLDIHARRVAARHRSDPQYRRRKRAQKSSSLAKKPVTSRKPSKRPPRPKSPRLTRVASDRSVESNSSTSESSGNVTYGSDKPTRSTRAVRRSISFSFDRHRKKTGSNSRPGSPRGKRSPRGNSPQREERRQAKSARQEAIDSEYIITDKNATRRHRSSSFKHKMAHFFRADSKRRSKPSTKMKRKKKAPPVDIIDVPPNNESTSKPSPLSSSRTFISLNEPRTLMQDEIPNDLLNGDTFFQE